ncbi:MAG: tol-pal system-associated acyl-CoA thioesterase [Methylotenera sp.]
MLSNQTFSWLTRVYYEDTDAGGVVYHSQYLNFLERARTEWLRHLGFDHNNLRDEFKLVFVVHSMQIQFKKPAKLDDLLTISSELIKIGRSSFEFFQKIQLYQEDKANQQTLLEARIKLACVDTITFKPIGIPEQIRQKMEQL